METLPPAVLPFMPYVNSGLRSPKKTPNLVRNRPAVEKRREGGGGGGLGTFLKIQRTDGTKLQPTTVTEH